MTAAEIERELDRLFALPLEEFTAARDALWKRLRASDPEGAARVKALKKPSVPAWAVNQVVHGAPLLWRNVLKAGQALRASPPAMREAIAERRAALNAVRKKAEEILEGAGHAASPQMMNRVTSTLEALATYGGAEGYPVPGRLSEELTPPGLEELAALALLPGAPVPHPGEAETPAGPAPPRAASPKAKADRMAEAAERARLKDRSAAAARELAEKRRVLGEADRALAAVELKVASVRAEIEALGSKLEDARRREKALAVERAAVQSRAQDAASAVRAAEAEVEAAASALERKH